MKTKAMMTKSMRLAFGLITGVLLLSVNSAWAEDKSAYCDISFKEGYPYDDLHNR
jgi:hypothetical protein